MENINQIFTDIARLYLGITTLETRNSDSLDFHDVSVWSIHDALKAAFAAGAKATGSTTAGLPIRFDDYEVHGVREFNDDGRTSCEQVPDEEAGFWSLYGHIPGEGVECIGDFTTREHAEEIYARITGRSYGRKGGCP